MGTDYYYIIRALTGDEVDSTDSSELQGSTKSYLPEVDGNAAVDEGTTYQLTFDANSNPVTSWSVYWGDGETDDYTSTAVVATHTFYGDASSRDVLIRYEDDDGVYDFDPLTVTINNLDPAPSLTGDSSVAEGDTYVLGLAVSDPDRDRVVEWTIDWDDGSTLQTIYGHPSSVTHIYAHHDTYTITATAVDSRGGSDDTTKALTVTDVAPTLSISGYDDYATDRSYTLTLTAADPGEDSFSWIIDWGDNSSNTTVAAASFHSGQSDTVVTHTYSDDGPYTISVDTSGTPQSTTLPADKTVEGGQAQLYVLTLGGYETQPNSPTETIDLGNSYFHIKAENNEMVDGNGDVLPFGGSTTKYYLSLTRSEFDDALRDLIEGSLHVSCIGDSNYDLDLSWPDDIGNGIEIGGAAYEDNAYTGQITVHPDTIDHDNLYRYANGYFTYTFDPVSVKIDTPWDAIEGPTGSAYTGGLAIVQGGARELEQPGYPDHYPSLTVEYALGGDATYGSDYTLEGINGVSVAYLGNNRISVTFDKDDGFGLVHVVPVDDSTPEWTENVLFMLDDPAVTRPTDGTDRTTVEIVDDNDLAVSLQDGILLANFDDDDQNDVPDYLDSYVNPEQPDDDLYRIDLTAPLATSLGATIQLVGPGCARFWNDAFKSEHLGDGAVTWIAGQDEIPSCVWVELLAGSAHVDDMTFSLYTNEYTAVNPPENPTWAVNQEPVSRTGIGVKMLYNGQEQADGGFSVLPGQRVWLSLVIEKPTEFDVVAPHWGTPDGHPFLDYVASGSLGVLTPFPYPSDDYLHGTNISFCWADNGGIFHESASVVVGGHTVDAGIVFQVQPVTVSAKMTVVRQPLVLGPGAPFFRPLQVALVSFASQGMQLTADASDHDPVHPGTIQGLQIVDTYRSVLGTTKTVPAQSVGARVGAAGLDGGFPYATGRFVSALAFGLQSLQIWDSPWLAFNNLPLRSGALMDAWMLSVNDSFSTYVMYKAAAEGSCWVPLERFDWRWSAIAYRTGPTTARLVYGYVSGNPQPSATSVHPVWTCSVGGNLYETIPLPGSGN